MGVEGIPIDGHAVLPEGAQCKKQTCPLGVVLVCIRKCGNRRAGMAGGELLASQRTQRGARSTFEEEVVPLVFEVLDCAGKFDGGAGMVGPVRRVGGFGSGDGASGDGGDKGPSGRAQVDLGNSLAQGLNHGIHHGGVEGMRGMQVAEDDFFRFELLLKFDCIRFRTGHDTEGRSVVGRDLKRRGKNFRDGIGAGVHRHHGTARQVLH